MNEGIKIFNSFVIVVYCLCYCLSWLYLKIKKKDVFYIFLLRNIERVEMCFIKKFQIKFINIYYLYIELFEMLFVKDIRIS